MNSPPNRFPYVLDRADISRYLPHRGDLFACQQLQVLAPLHYVGMALWHQDNVLLQGHFPDFPVVPGVLLIEAACQLAGAGLASASPTALAHFSERIGLLTSVRQSSFRRAVLPEQAVTFAIRCRRIGASAVQVKAVARVGETEVAEIETLMVYTAPERLREALI